MAEPKVVDVGADPASYAPEIKGPGPGEPLESLDVPCCGTDDNFKDPWAHRSSGMRCITCMWFVPKVGFTPGVGRCRRHAPTMNGYPVVFSQDWCGDHKLDENK